MNQYKPHNSEKRSSTAGYSTRRQVNSRYATVDINELSIANDHLKGEGGSQNIIINNKIELRALSSCARNFDCYTYYDPIFS